MTEEEIAKMQAENASYKAKFELGNAGLQRLGIAADLHKLGEDLKLDDFAVAVENSLNAKFLANPKFSDLEPVKKIADEKTTYGMNKARAEFLKALGDDENITKQLWDKAIEENPKNPDGVFYKNILSELKKKANLTDSELKQQGELYKREIAERTAKLLEFEKNAREKELEIKKYTDEIIPNIRNEAKSLIEQRDIAGIAFREFLQVPITPITQAQNEQQKVEAGDMMFETLYNSILKRYTIERNPTGGFVFYLKGSQTPLYKENTSVYKTHLDLFTEEAKRIGLYDYTNNAAANSTQAGTGTSQSQALIDKKNLLNKFSQV